MRTIETLTATVNGTTKTAELRETKIAGLDALAIWYAGDQTGEMKQQFAGSPESMTTQWAKMAEQLKATPVKV